MAWGKGMASGGQVSKGLEVGPEPGKASNAGNSHCSWRTQG